MNNRLTLPVQHTSLQFSDDRRQQRHDCRQLFAKGRRYPIKTGTEAGPETFFNDYLKEFAKDFNHAIHFGRGNWIAVDRDIIKPRWLTRDTIFVVENDRIFGNQHDQVIPWIGFDHVDDRVGRIYQAAAHYSTKGRRPGDPNYDTNKMVADALTKWFHQKGKGRALAFANGDFNMLDSVPAQDWAFGGAWTSMADELDKYRNTGHGPIDGLCSYNKDGRVSAKRFNVLRDNKMFMHSDHFVVRGAWAIKKL